MLNELNKRCGSSFDVSTPDAVLLESYNSMNKADKNGFFNEASELLKRPRERVYQMFMNLMKDVMYDYKITKIESLTIHNYALANKHHMTVN